MLIEHEQNLCNSLFCQKRPKIKIIRKQTQITKTITQKPRHWPRIGSEATSPILGKDSERR